MNSYREEALEVLRETDFDDGGTYPLPLAGNECAYICEGYTDEHPYELQQFNIAAGSLTRSKHLTEEETINILIEEMK